MKHGRECKRSHVNVIVDERKPVVQLLWGQIEIETHRLLATAHRPVTEIFSSAVCRPKNIERRTVHLLANVNVTRISALHLWSSSN